MTYTTDSPLVGQGAASAAAIQSWLEARGRALAPVYGLNGQYTPVPSELGQAIVDACREWPVTINADIAASQIEIETAGWQSEYARERNNPGGIGAIDSNPDEAYRFPSIREGVRAHVAHMLTYAAGEGPWTATDPRYSRTPKAWRGTTTTIGSLTGRWATAGHYGDSIVIRANLLLAHVAEGGWDMTPIPPDGWTPPPIRISYVPVGRRNRPGTRITVRRNIWHDTGNPDAGANAEMHRRFVHNGGGRDRVSFQYVIDDHEIIALIPEGERAFHALEPCNSESNGLELCVNSDGDWNRTLWNAAWLGAELERRGVSRHDQHHDCTGKNCPARLRNSGQWDEFLTRIAYFRNISQPEDEGNPWFLHLGDGVHADYAFRWGFRGVVEGLAIQRYPADPNSAALALFGPPEEEEWYGVDGHAYQRCTRLILHYIPNNPPPWDVIFEAVDMPLPNRRVT